MAPSRPQDINRAWSDALAVGDADRMLDLYEPDAVLVVEPGGDPIVGHDAIRGALGWFLSQNLEAAFEQRYCLVTSDIALVRADFVLTGPDGTEIRGSSSEVLREQADGTWRYVADHAFGAVAHTEE